MATAALHLLFAGLFVKDRSIGLGQWPESGDLGDGETKKKEKTTRHADVSLSD